MIQKIGLEVEGFFVKNGKVLMPPAECGRDGSEALIEVRTDPCSDKFSLFTSLARNIEREREIASENGGRFIIGPVGIMAADEYRRCQKRISDSGTKELHGANAFSVFGGESYRNTVFDTKSASWQLLAATHINVSRDVVVVADGPTCEKCGKVQRTSMKSESVLPLSWVTQYYTNLSSRLAPLCDISGRMVRKKPFGIELRSISSPKQSSLNAIMRLCSLVFECMPEDGNIEQPKGE